MGIYDDVPMVTGGDHKPIVAHDNHFSGLSLETPCRYLALQLVVGVQHVCHASHQVGLACSCSLLQLGLGSGLSRWQLRYPSIHGSASRAWYYHLQLVVLELNCK